MDPRRVRELLEGVAAGATPVEQALSALRTLPFADLGYAHVDHHRALRSGVPEVIFGERKTAEQIVGIARALLDAGNNLLVTRVDPAKAAAVRAELPDVRYAQAARVLRLDPSPIVRPNVGPIAVVTAGTSDIDVAEEAVETLDAVGLVPERYYDVGVAGIHRLLHRIEAIQRATAVIVIAGMEGALPSVMGGMIAVPVVAVPTSVGYGVALSGFTALMAMLTSCASGVTVVNIDSGFGAAMAVHRIAIAAARVGAAQDR